MSGLRKFDEDRECAKCGGKNIHNKWRPNSGMSYRKIGENGPITEHIERHCLRCHFEWFERPLTGEAP